ncbi:HAMP domain-containing histidine kinase [Microvirga sp. ACRRW]|uniref:sensor histidine kinase n=1 Tax=Microvirga sp. ACRRW TaxID=2918205 RepID=UPI001EF6B752|nr:HAMP domain-containing sensor histidine kinase [Microvirga sp. ACRRW]MCG7392075.1 HAMP domain-containing histidine kinase [Microvirga sp. ACRRW]
MSVEQPQSLMWRILSQFGLSARLLLLTVLFVMIAEVLIYVPSIANFRQTWLNDRLAAAQIAAMVLDAAPEESLPGELELRLLQGVGAQAIALRGGGRRSLLAINDAPPEVGKSVDLRDARWADLVSDAFAVLFTPTDKPIRVIGHGMGVDFVEIILDQRPLRNAMLEFSRNILLLSLFISIITASLVYLTLQWVIVRPVRRLTGNIAEFSGNPEDASRVIQPTDRADEIGLAEQALARMETTLADELRQKRRLAQLGLAVSKINHELRNMLTTAQLLTDRLERVNDETAQRVAPRLVATLDRAIAFCETTLAYGRAAEPLPQRRLIPLAPLIEDLSNLTDLAPEVGIAFRAHVPEDLMVDADKDQLSRVLVNLVRNAVQALSQTGVSEGDPCIDVTASREGNAVTILVRDNGPGIPERVKADLFSPFQSSARKGGTGLGLTIVAELVQLHGGTISLDDSDGHTCFRITIPDRAAIQ